MTRDLNGKNVRWKYKSKRNSYRTEDGSQLRVFQDCNAFRVFIGVYGYEICELVFPDVLHPKPRKVCKIQPLQLGNDSSEITKIGQKIISFSSPCRTFDSEHSKLYFIFSNMSSGCEKILSISERLKFQVFVKILGTFEDLSVDLQ